MISAASVKEKLKNLSVSSGKTLQELLIAYALERTIYRLTISQYKEHFILKGGIFLYALEKGNFSRATSDIDFLAQNISNQIPVIKSAFTDIFSINPDDPLTYNLQTLTIQNITELRKYHGLNISIIAYLDKTKLPISIDIAFGDVIHPDKILTRKDPCTPVFTAAKTRKRPNRPSTEERMKRCYTYSTQFHSATKRKKECYLQRHGWI